MPVLEIRFCPSCRGRLDWRAIHYAGIEHPVCVKCGFVLWQNPKPSVEALIVRDGASGLEILLGRHPRGWDLPGNFLNAPDRIEAALIRECRREMGIEVAVEDILGVFEDTFFDGRNQVAIPMISIVYVCRIKSGEPRPADLIDDVRWFSLAEAPTDVAFPAVARAIEAMQRRAAMR